MTAPLLLPTSRLVAAGWLRLALPGVGVGAELPDPDADTAAYAAARAAGFLRIAVVGGAPDRYVPAYRQPVVQVECWMPPPATGGQASWARAEQLANRLVAATADRALAGVLIDLSTAGDYAPARVHTVTALTEPDRVEEDDSDWARADIDIALDWTPA